MSSCLVLPISDFCVGEGGDVVSEGVVVHLTYATPVSTIRKTIVTVFARFIRIPGRLIGSTVVHVYPSSGALEKQLRTWDCRNRVVLFVDTNFFGDGEASNAVNPIELDLVLGLAFRYGKAELAVIHEHDFPVDRTRLVQRYIIIQLQYEFEWTKSSSIPSTARALRHQ